ncbi:succinate dehydrogenase assembly factor 2 [Amylibacter sp. SFDW26]|uniref:FAD assembly factor SdhE n=1 Tax=Amylibacter sp. SFDW26 TaxID=2652722 RepID=UPI00126183E1|nr:succinate dehydrogenase assembly factor 2 [Amylibacter sp. SFDW26]KAB7615807.1 succinate dehydrogenase assembly factor 2 [Amylibacter sp. SFDW26]
MSEDRETRLKRLRLRSWRRGIKEMDLMFGSFADEKMAELTDAELDAHEILMSEHDQDLLVWVTGQQETPKEIKTALSRVKTHYFTKINS